MNEEASEQPPVDSQDIFRHYEIIIAPTIFTYLGAVSVIKDSFFGFLQTIGIVKAANIGSGYSGLFLFLLDSLFLVASAVYSSKPEFQKFWDSHLGPTPNTESGKARQIFSKVILKIPANSIAIIGLITHLMYNFMLILESWLKWPLLAAVLALILAMKIRGVWGKI